MSPATLAASSGSPFGVPATRAAQASGDIRIVHSATASRAVMSLSPTSTIREASVTRRPSLLLFQRPEEHDPDPRAGLRFLSPHRDHGTPTGPGHRAQPARTRMAG